MTRRHVRFAVATGVSLVLLTGCATADAGSGAPSTQSASPTPTCAVAEQPGVEPPPGCISYDAEENMASNEQYRERMPQADEGRAEGEALISPVTEALTALQTSGAPVTADAVRDALAAAGVIEDDIQTDGDPGSIAFGAALAGGGCIFGGVTTEAVSVEVGGFIMDGGCLAMVGH